MEGFVCRNDRLVDMNYASGHNVLLQDIGLIQLWGFGRVPIWHLLPGGTGHGLCPALAEGRAVCENHEVHLRTSLYWEEVNQRNQGIIHVKGENAGKCYQGSLLSQLHTSRCFSEGVADNFLGKVETWLGL